MLRGYCSGLRTLGLGWRDSRARVQGSRIRIQDVVLSSRMFAIRAKGLELEARYM